MQPRNLVVFVSFSTARKIGSVPHGNYHVLGFHCEVWSIWKNIYIAIYHQNFKCNQSGKIEERRQITNFLPVYKIIHTYNYILNTLTDNAKLSKKPFV